MLLEQTALDTAKHPGGDGALRSPPTRGGWQLEADLTVGGLPTTLPVAVLLFLQDLDGWRGDSLVDVAAAEAGAVFTIPVPLRDHGAAASGAVPGQGSLRHRASLLLRFQISCRAFRLPPGLADGFGLKGAALLAGARFTPRVVGPPLRTGFGSPASLARGTGFHKPVIVITSTY